MQSVKEAIVFSGGSVDNLKQTASFLPEDAVVICADSGVLNCEKLNFCANVVVGDFDSFDLEKARLSVCAQNAEFIILNPVKDDTDTEFALDKAVEKGCRRIYLLGATGTRLDHSLANIFLMEKYFKQGVEVIIVNENNILHYLNNSELTLKKGPMNYVSVIPLEKVMVSNSGFKYPLCKEYLYRDSSRGISNELVTSTGSITVSGGSALVVESRD